jgi:DNA-binding GntR family transcriptional regulator
MSTSPEPPPARRGRPRKGEERPRAPTANAVGKSAAHRTLSAAAAEELRRRIFSGDYPGGTQLRQDALAAELGASRIPIREALLQLEAEGLVKIEPHRGATVTTLDPKTVSELYEIRALIEPELTRLSIPRLTAEDFKALDALLASSAAQSKSGDPRPWGELNTLLHMTLYRRADRPRLLALAGGLLRECDRYTRLQLSRGEAELARAEREHAELVALARAGDVDGAARLCHAHIRKVADRLGAIISVSG